MRARHGAAKAASMGIWMSKVFYRKYLLIVLSFITAPFSSACADIKMLFSYATEQAEIVYLGVADIDLFALSKSENSNTVHYAVKVKKTSEDESVSDVWAYWAIVEGGKVSHFESILSYEENVYGVDNKKISPEGASFVIGGLNTRKIEIIEKQEGEETIFEPKVTIDGRPALLTGVYLDLDAELIYMYGLDWEDRETKLEEAAEPTL
jgi:hypothetical protein